MDNILKFSILEEEDSQKINDYLKKKNNKIIYYLIILIVLFLIFVSIIFMLKRNEKNNYRILYEDYQIKKPIGSKIKNKIIQLKTNNLKIAITQNPYIKETSVSIIIPFGNNINIIPGFANYAKNLFYSGSKKYNDNTLFRSLINEIGGKENSILLNSETIFQFFSPSNEFENIFQIFSNMIDQPLLNKTFAKNYINLIHSEFLDKNISGLNNFLEIVKFYVNQKHPFYFMINGNNESLNSIDFDKLYNYTLEYLNYCFDPNKFKMVIYSNKEIKEIENLILKYFNFDSKNVSNEFKNLIENKIKSFKSEKIFNENIKGKIIHSQISNINILSTSFEVPGTNRKDGIIQYLLIHLENIYEGSLLQYLRNKNYVLEIELSKDDSFLDKNIFIILFYLTKEGIQNFNEVLIIIFSYFKFLKENCVNEEIWNNYKKASDKINKIKYETKQKDILDITEKLSQNFLRVDNEEYYQGGYFLKYDKNLTQNFFNSLNINNALLIIDTNSEFTSIKDFKKIFNNKNETYLRYYGTKLTEGKIPNELIEKLNNLDYKKYNFKLPKLNNFITNKTEEIFPCYEMKNTKCSNDEYNNKTYNPLKINTKEYELIYLIDKSFHLPIVKAQLNINFAYLGENDYLHLYIFSQYLLFEINRGKYYQIKGGGISVKINIIETGLSFQIFSNSDNIYSTIKLLINSIKDSINKNKYSQFQVYFYSIHKMYTTDSGFSLFNSYILIKDLFSVNSFSQNLINEEKKVFSFSYEEITQSLNNLLERVTPFNLYIVGDINKNELNNICDYIKNTLNPKINLRDSLKQRFIGNNNQIYLIRINPNIFEKENWVMTSFQLLNLNEKEIQQFEIYEKCNIEFFNNYLKYKKQIGYRLEYKFESISDYPNLNYLFISIGGTNYFPSQIDKFIDEAILKSFDNKCLNFKKIYEYINQKKEKLIDIHDRLNQIINLKINENEKNNNNLLLSYSYDDVLTTVKKYLKEKPSKATLLLYSNINQTEIEKDFIESLKTKSSLSPNIKKIQAFNTEFLKDYTKIPENNGKIFYIPYENLEIIFDGKTIQKPLNYDKEIEIIKIYPSEYKFMLIEDKYNKKGGIQIKCNYGFLNDLIDGFSHYSQHNFLGGTKQFSRENIFNLIKKFNGFIQGYTYNRKTIFQIFGPNFQLEKIINIMSNIIQNRDFNIDFLNNELIIIDNEFQSYNNSLFGINEILKNNANKEHNYYKNIPTSGIGNYNILSKINLDERIENLKKYYDLLFNPKNCFFSIISNRSLDEMRYLAFNYFNFQLNNPTGDFVDKFISKNSSFGKVNLFNKENLGKFIHIKSDTTYLLKIIFILPNFNNYIEQSPFEFMKYLLNGNNEGSLKYYFNIYNYANSFDFLIDYKNNYMSDSVISELNINLNENGINNIDNVIEGIFSSINIAKKNFNEDLYNNIQLIFKKNFLFKEKTNIEINIENFDNINNYEIYGNAGILGGYYFYNYTKNNIMEFFDYFTPENSIIILNSNKIINSKYFENPELKTTIAFNIPYHISSLSKENLSNLKKINDVNNYQFLIREKNEKINSNIKIVIPCYLNSPYKCDNYEYDDKKINENYNQLYKVISEPNILSLTKIDKSFKIPLIKGLIKIDFNENEIKNLLNTNNKKGIYYLFSDYLIYKLYNNDLYEIGFNFSIIENSFKSFQLKFNIYSEQWDEFINFFKQYFYNNIKEYELNNLKSRLIERKKIGNDPLMRVENELNLIFKKFITSNTLEDDISNDDIENINLDDYNNLIKTIQNLEKKITFFTIGDINIDKITSITNLLSEFLIKNKNNINLQSSLIKKNIYLKDKTSIIYYTKNENLYDNQSSIMIFYQLNSTDIINDFKYYSLCIGNHFYENIRTQKQIGYNIKNYITEILGIKYYIFYTKGSNYSPEEIDKIFNQEVKNSFNIKCPELNDIYKYEKIKNKPTFEDRFNYLYDKIISGNYNKEEKEDITNEKKWDDIIYNIKNYFENKPRRIAIYYYKTNLTDQFINESANKYKNYYLNDEIKNEITNDLNYLNNYNNE